MQTKEVAMRAPTSVVFAPGHRHCTLTTALHLPSAWARSSKYWNSTALNLQYMAANKQASKHTHIRAQCSPASVGLAQAHPNETNCSLFPHNQPSESELQWLRASRIQRPRLEFWLCTSQFLSPTKQDSIIQLWRGGYSVWAYSQILSRQKSAHSWKVASQLGYHGNSQLGS